MGKIIKILKKDKILRTFKYINYKIICNLIFIYQNLILITYNSIIIYIFYFIIMDKSTII